MDVLFITATRIGDAVLSTGALGHLVDSLPEARFTIACGPAAAPLFAAVPRLARIHVMRKQRRYGAHWWTLWRKTRATSWHTIVDLRASGLAYLLRARRRLVLSPFKTDDHRVLRNSRVMGAPGPLAPRLWLSEEARRAGEVALPVAGSALALGPTANWPGKQWAIDRFAALVAQLTAPGAPFAEAPLVVLGGPGEEAAARALIAALPRGNVVDLVGRVDLLAAAATLSRARLYIGNDSGLMHLAAAAGTPTIGLFGPSREALYAPWGALTATVRGEPYEAIIGAPDYDYRSAHSYMAAISVAMVETAVRELLARQVSSASAA